MKHPLYENWLTQQGVRWEYWESVPLARIDTDASLRNQARLDRSLKEARVASYAQAMRDGAEFPALIVYQIDETKEKLAAPGADMVIITGNHRVAAAHETGRQFFDVYVVSEPSPLVRERLIRTANFLEGSRPEDDEPLHHALWLHTNDGYSVAAAAKLTNLSRKTVEVAVRSDRVRNRLYSMGVDAGAFTQQILDRLHPITLDAPLAAAGRAVRTYRLNIELVAEMVRGVRAQHSEEAQVQAVKDFTRLDHVAERPAMQGMKGEFPRNFTNANRLRGAFVQAQRLIERTPTPGEAGVHTADEFQRIVDDWARLQSLVGTWLTKGRRTFGVRTSATSSMETDHVDRSEPVVRSA